jgi:hypothetical protein
MSSEPAKPEPFRIPQDHLTIDYLKMLLSRPPGEPIYPFAERVLKSDPTISQLSRWLYRKLRKKLDLDTLDYVCELVSARLSPLSDDVDGRLISDVLMILKESEPVAAGIDAPIPPSGSNPPLDYGQMDHAAIKRSIEQAAAEPPKQGPPITQREWDTMRWSKGAAPMPDGRWVENPATPPPSGKPTPEAEKPDSKPEAPAELPDLVTLDQAAAMVHKTKRALEYYKTEGTLPDPFKEGGGGKAALYDWRILGPWLTDQFGIPLPAKYPRHRES